MPSTRDDHAAVATIPTPVVSTSMSWAPRVQLRRRSPALERCFSPANSGSIAAAVAATMSMRTNGILFLRFLAEPADQIADIGVRCAIFLRRDVLDHVPMRGRAIRSRSVRKVVCLGEEL